MLLTKLFVSPSAFAVGLLLFTPLTVRSSPPGAPKSPEMLQNGAFKTGLAHWKVEESGAKGKADVTKEGPSHMPSMRLTVGSVGDQPWRLQVHQGGLKITKGKPYILEFWAKSDRDSVIMVNCMQNHEPWEHHGAATEVRLTKAWKKISYPFSGPWDDDNARVTFTNLGTVVGQTYWFAGCSLKGGKG